MSDVKTLLAKKTETISKALYMVVGLSSQAEEWAFFLKDQLAQDFKFKLNNMLDSMRGFRKFSEKFVDYEDVADDAQIFSEVLEFISSADSEQKAELLSVVKSMKEKKEVAA